MASVNALEINRAQKARALLSVAAKNGTLPKQFLAVIRKIVELNQQVIKKGSSRELEVALDSACAKLRQMQGDLLIFNVEIYTAINEYSDACEELKQPTNMPATNGMSTKLAKQRR